MHPCQVRVVDALSLMEMWFKASDRVDVEFRAYEEARATLSGEDLQEVGLRYCMAMAECGHLGGAIERRFGMGPGELSRALDLFDLEGKGLQRRYLDAVPRAPASFYPAKEGSIACASFITVSLTKNGGKILECTDEAGRFSMIFLSASEAALLADKLLE